MPRKIGKTNFGAKLRELRESRGISQKSLGELVDIHPNTIAKLERGEQEPAWPLVLAFASVLDVKCTAFGEMESPTADAPPAPAVKPPRGRPKKSK